MWLENHRHWQESAPKYLIFFNRLGFHIGSDHWYWYWCLHINLASVVNCSGICFLPWKQDSLDFWFGSKIKTRLGIERIIANYIMCFNSRQWFCQMQPKMLNQNFERKLLKHSPSPDTSWSPRFHGGVAWNPFLCCVSRINYNVQFLLLEFILLQSQDLLMLNSCFSFPYSLRHCNKGVWSHFFWSKLFPLAL